MWLSYLKDRDLPLAWWDWMDVNLNRCYLWHRYHVTSSVCLFMSDNLWLILVHFQISSLAALKKSFLQRKGLGDQACWLIFNRRLSCILWVALSMLDQDLRILLLGVKHLALKQAVTNKLDWFSSNWFPVEFSWFDNVGSPRFVRYRIVRTDFLDQISELK